MFFEHRITKNEESRPVLHILKDTLGLSSRLITKLKKVSGSLLLNECPVFTNVIVKEDDILKVIIDIDETSEGVIPESMPLNILYEDEILIALNKPPHTVIHPTYNFPTGTLANGLAHYLLSNGEKCLIRPVSRLDKDTSGIVIFAKNQYLQDYLSKNTKKSGHNALVKKYYGIVSGIFNPSEGQIELPIKRVEGSTIERMVSEDGYYSLTKYKTLENYKLRAFQSITFPGCTSLNTLSTSNASLVEFELMTGRTHQIRVHAMYSSHPLIGETLYNKDSQGSSLDLSLNGLIDRQCLHSREVSFIHPLTGKLLVLKAEIPDDMKNVLDQMLLLPKIL
jgi:23S rRNA pseudouridine1911/1915/1917 synthase